MALTPQEIVSIKKLIEAAKPFMSDDFMTVTCGNIPFIETLEEAIEAVEIMLENAEGE